MSKEILLAQMRRRREQVVPLGDGKSVTIVRPPETEFGSMLKHVDVEKKLGTWEVGLEHVQKYTVGWDGFKEADLLGSAVGGDAVVAFDADIWAAVVADSTAYQQKVADAILNSVVTYLNSKAESAKNSSPD